LSAAAIGAFARSMAAVFNRSLIPLLWELNGWDEEALPRIVCGDLESPNPAELAQFLTALTGAGAMLFPDRDLENHLRKIVGLPLAPEDGGLDGDPMEGAMPGDMPPMPEGDGFAKSQPRHPAGAPEGRGGQFAPSEGAGGPRPHSPEAPTPLSEMKGARGIEGRDRHFKRTPSARTQALAKLVTGAFGDGEFLGDNDLLKFHGLDGTSFVTSFEQGKRGPYVQWDEMKLPPEARGRNFRQFVDELFALYRSDGQDAVLMAAGYDVGPYVWARAGVIPFPEDWEKHKSNLRPRVDALPIDEQQRADLRTILDSEDPKAIWRLADAPGGKSLLVNPGDRKLQVATTWRGYFLLNDEEQNARLYKYVRRQA
jgi:hypothetical protein